MHSSVEDFRLAAKRRLSRIAFDYLDGGAEDGYALRRNRDAYARWLFRPRVMTDVSRCTTATSIWGREMAAPMVVGPTGLNGLFWPKADELLAQAAAEAVWARRDRQAWSWRCAPDIENRNAHDDATSWMR
ncbi:alpha-hydroxy-acid oxidizing protein [Ralstonia syzygii]|uniref:alpha-hydroxy-acid oxidizing protein n=1 Tax=Ralstonia syzygii TaxID=28097 RepID=UPI0018D1C954|nr:alpha-hydroxy-acid oxidizing protein [Ralstonia syzygii]